MEVSLEASLEESLQSLEVFREGSRDWRSDARPHNPSSNHITISNTGSFAAQLISRHWVITDAEKKVQEVRGLGVVGEQPLLQPSASFEYVSGTVLNTAVGTMHGSYQLTAVDGTQFEVAIPAFTLTMPRVLH
jgi:ApaG protein